jgi:hypothetical protein
MVSDFSGQYISENTAVQNRSPGANKNLTPIAAAITIPARNCTQSTVLDKIARIRQIGSESFEMRKAAP